MHRFKFKLSLLVSVLFMLQSVQAQKKNISLEDAYQKHAFYERSVRGINWMNDGQFYSSLESEKEHDNIVKYDITTGNKVNTLLDGSNLNGLRFSGYDFSEDESQVLLKTESESIYRHSTKANYYLYNLTTKKISKLAEGSKQSYATFSPDGKKVAYVQDNNLYCMTLENSNTAKISNDGEWNKIINGGSDWVYEEEFGFAKAFFWSPTSNEIAYYRFDENKVPEYNMQKWGNLYPQDYKFKYPKAGELNSEVQIKVYSLSSGKSMTMDIGEETDIYIPRLYWTGVSGMLSIVKMNRLQNKLEILHADISSGHTKSILTEISSTYVDINYTDDITYLKNSNSIIRTSEKSGFKHIYHYRLDGKEILQITKGNWDVDEFIGIDEKRKLIYFISSENSPMERDLYSIKLNGKGKKLLSAQRGSNSANFSNDFKYYINDHSSVESPKTVSLHAAPSGKQIKTLEDNSLLKSNLKSYNIAKTNFFHFKTTNGDELNGAEIRPNNFDPNKKYPILLFVYGGPGSQTVRNTWAANHYYYHQYLVQKGYVIITVDNRGTGARGKEFKHITYENLGKFEVEDQIEVAKYLNGLTYVDKARIGIWGWSYGGYMSSLTLFKGADYFKTAVAVAPVSNWRYYDTVYTERYLKRPQDNPSGYDNNSPNQHAGKLKGNFLLIHGTGDDNVHFQNAIELQNALIAAGKQFDSFYYPNRNHGIYGGNTRLHLYQMMADYILEKL